MEIDPKLKSTQRPNAYPEQRNTHTTTMILCLKQSQFSRLEYEFIIFIFHFCCAAALFYSHSIPFLCTYECVSIESKHIDRSYVSLFSVYSVHLSRVRFAHISRVSFIIIYCALFRFVAKSANDFAFFVCIHMIVRHPT